MGAANGKHRTSEPVFSRSDVARILNVTALTIANREKRDQYPRPRRDLNGYRVYSLNDVFNLQLITYAHLDPRPVMSMLYDKGYTDVTVASKLVDAALGQRQHR